MKKLFLSLTILSLAFTMAMAQDTPNPINTQVYSLDIAPDAVSSAMGDVGAATTPDLYSQFWNPSKYANIEDKSGFAMSYTPWLSSIASDIDLVSLVGFYKIKDNQAISASMRYFSLGEVIVREQFEDPGYSLDPYEMVLDVAYSRKLSEHFSGSVSLRYILSDLLGGDDPAGNAFAADISGYYTHPAYFGREQGSYSLGFNISNIGTKISYDGGNTDYFLPANMKIGGSISYPIDYYNKLNFSLDLNKLLVPTPDSTSNYMDKSSISGIFSSFSDAPDGLSEEINEISTSFGVEYVYNNQFFLRGGYHYENEMKGNRKYYTFGAGFKMSVFSLDASYLVAESQSNPLDKTLRFSLAFNTEGLANLLGK